MQLYIIVLDEALEGGIKLCLNRQHTVNETFKTVDTDVSPNEMSRVGAPDKMKRHQVHVV